MTAGDGTRRGGGLRGVEGRGRHVAHGGGLAARAGPSSVQRERWNKVE
jgi:hypothetical protein